MAFFDTGKTAKAKANHLDLAIQAFKDDALAVGDKTHKDTFIKWYNTWDRFNNEVQSTIVEFSPGAVIEVVNTFRIRLNKWIKIVDGLGGKTKKVKALALTESEIRSAKGTDWGKIAIWGIGGFIAVKVIQSMTELGKTAEVFANSKDKE